MAEKLPGKVSAKTLATLFGVTERWIQQLTKDGIISGVKTKSQRGLQYPLRETVQAYIRHVGERQSGSKSSKQALDEARIAKLELERRALETKVQIQEGAVHTTRDVELVMGDMIGAFRTRLLAMPQTAAPSLTEVTEVSEIKSILAGEVHTLCELLSEYSPEDFYQRNAEYLGVVESDEQTETG